MSDGRLGMVCEGLSREVYKVGEAFWSTLTYSLLEQECRAYGGGD